MPSDEPAQLVVHCRECDKHVLATVAGSTHYYNPEEDTPGLYSLVRCQSQGHPILVLQEDYGQGFEEDTYRLWPEQNRHLSSVIPYRLRAEFEEARKCFNAKAYKATGVMVGRTLEAACDDKGSKRKDLDSSLKALKDQGDIDQRLYEWADALRFLRNDSAHDGDVTRQDAEDALALAEALLDHLYVFTTRFDAFQARRQKGRKRQASSASS